MKKLKRCPFCGKPAITFKIPENTPEETALHPQWIWNNPCKWIIGCKDDLECMGNFNHMTMLFMTEESAIEAWNRRASDDHQTDNF